MVMNTRDIFPTQIFTFQNNHIDNQELISNIDSLECPQVKHSGVISILHDAKRDAKFVGLFNWFNDCLEKVKNNLLYDCESFQITNSWINICLPQSGMALNFHRHSLSFYSGIYYFTEGASTVFEDPVLHRTQAQIEVLRSNYQPTFIEPAEPGKLCLFPSWLYHGTQAHWDNHRRVIMSFNTLPSGKINYNTATDSKARITVND